MLVLKEYGPLIDTNLMPPDDYIRQKAFCVEQKEYRLRTDKSGFIISGADQGADQDVIVAVGDSVCECLYVEEEERLWANLERKLNAGGWPVSVLNGGVSDSHLLHIINVFLNKIVPLKPKAVLVLQGGADRPPSRDRASYWSKSPAITTVRRRGERDQFNADLSWREVDYTDRQKLLDILISAARAFEIPLVYITSPVPRHYPDGWHDECRALNQQTREFCASNQVQMVDLERDMPNFGWMFHDDAHLNRYGCRAASELISKSVMALRPAPER